jgi:glycerol dehydrogenase-like iron-containing ADH family enzyme
MAALSGLGMGRRACGVAHKVRKAWSAAPSKASKGPGLKNEVGCVMQAIVQHRTYLREKTKTLKTLTYEVLISFSADHEPKGPQNLLQASNALTP